MRPGRATLLLAFILLGGLALRLYHLGTESLWLDEGISLLIARWDLASLLRGDWDWQLPLYPVILHYWMAIFGHGEVSGRMVSALCGALSVLLAYRVGASLFGRPAGLLAALFLALSPLHVLYSQEARRYSLHILLSLASMSCFLKVIRTGRAAIAAAYLATSLGLLYSQNLAWLIVAAQNAFVGIRWLGRGEAGKLSGKAWCLLQAILLALFSPGLVRTWSYYQKFHQQVQGGLPVEKATLSTLGRTLADYSGWSAAEAIYALLIAVALLSPFLARSARKSFTSLAPGILRSSESDGWGTLLCTLWLLIPIASLLAFSLLMTPAFVTRLTLGALPAFCLLSARGAMAIRPPSLRAASVAAIAAFSLLTLHDYYRLPHKERWREVAAYLDENGREGDLLVFHQGAYLKACFDRYSEKGGIARTRFPFRGMAVSEGNIGEFARLVGDRRRVWLILCQSGDNRGLMKKALGGEQALRNRMVYPYYNILARRQMEIEVCLFERR